MEWRIDSFTFQPFIRIDQQDEERSHFDIRELAWLHVGNDWELRTGIRKVFWGVNESQHLVDIINQTIGIIASVITATTLGLIVDDTVHILSKYKCVVLMGTISSLEPRELKSFELFRSNSKDVEMITFDELLARFENLQKLMLRDD